MALRPVFLLFVVMAGVLSAQSAEEYCSSVKTEGESCYAQCCQSLGYTWANGGCMVTGAQQDAVSSACGYCTDSYVACLDYYESGGSTESPSGSTESPGGYYDYDSGGSGCCSGFVVLSLLGVAALVPRV